MSDDDDVSSALFEIQYGSSYRGGPKGATRYCIFMEKVLQLPDPIKEAVLIATENKEISSPKLLAYINGKYPAANMSMTSVQRHRSKHGCHICAHHDKEAS